eukprot:594676-Rhodomonas_salina.1
MLPPLLAPPPSNHPLTRTSHTFILILRNPPSTLPYPLNPSTKTHSEVISVREIRKLMRPVVLNRGVGSDEVGRETRRVEEPVHALAFFLLPALLHYQDPANEQVVLEEKSALVRRDGIPVVPAQDPARNEKKKREARSARSAID